MSDEGWGGGIGKPFLPQNHSSKVTEVHGTPNVQRGVCWVAIAGGEAGDGRRGSGS